MNEEKRAKDYQGIRITYSVTAFFLDLAVLAVLLVSGLTFQLRDITAQASGIPFLKNSLYVLMLGVLFYSLHFPFHFLKGYIVEKHYNLSDQTFGKWFKDDLKRALVGLIVFLVLVNGIYFIMERFGGRWWAVAAFFWLFVTFVLAKLTPNVLVPFFFKYSTLRDETLKKDIRGLFQKCRVSLKDVYSINLSEKTKKANAFVCGIGGSRRVVLSDTLLNEFAPREILTVVAHELAHYINKDIGKLLAVNFLVIFTGFYVIHRLFLVSFDHFAFTGLADIANFPLFALFLVLFQFTTMPLVNAYSRRIEHKADRFSIETTNAPEEFAAMIEKLGRMNLADFRPHWLVELFFYDHPPIAKRAAFARSLRKS